MKKIDLFPIYMFLCMILANLNKDNFSGWFFTGLSILYLIFFLIEWAVEGRTKGHNK